MPRETTYAVLHLKVEIQNNSRTYTRPPYFVNISFKIFVYQFTLNVFYISFVHNALPAACALSDNCKLVTSLAIGGGEQTYRRTN